MGFENGKLVRVSLRAHDGDAEQVNTFHYDLDDNNDLQPNDPQSLADEFRDDARNWFQALFPATWTIDPVLVIEEKDPLEPLAARSEWTSGVAIAGTKAASGQNLPKGMCSVATLVTTHVGRRFRGRCFLPGLMNEADLDNGEWGAAPLAAWAAYLNAIPREPDIAGPGSGAVAKWGVYSRTQRAGNQNPYISPVISAVPKAKAFWLRSRDD